MSSQLKQQQQQQQQQNKEMAKIHALWRKKLQCLMVVLG